jgi:hypothetical protein
MDYSFRAYENIIQTGIDNGYEFEVFKNILDQKKAIYLRHDIDVDLGYALEMAKIESQKGIKSTYFMMLRSPVYNLLSRENTELLHKIINLGHEIGLHYDEGFYHGNETLNALISKEVEILESFFKIKVSTISFHQPSKKIIDNKVDLEGFYNTYDKEDMSGIFYLSDSNMAFKTDPIELIKSKVHDKIQILIHPIWWGRDKKYSSTEEIWEQGIISAFERMQRQLLETERAYGNKREFKIK